MDLLKERLDIARKIARELTGTIGEVDKEVLNRWRMEDDRHEEEYKEILGLLASGNKIWNELDEADRVAAECWGGMQKRGSHRLRVMWMRYAAVIVLVISLSVWGVYLWRGGEAELVLAKTDVGIHPGQPVLMMADGREIVLDRKNGTIEGTLEVGILNDSINGLDYGRVALQEGAPEGKEVYNTLRVPVGGFYRLTLSDGTSVWLNSMTRLRYPVNFTGNQRNVYLSGEAYFEVAKDMGCPFIVHTEGVDVKVYGTRFNVNSLEKGIVQTVLESGRVSVTVEETRKEVMLTPNDMAEFHRESGSVEVKRVDPYVYTAWKDGKFVFEDATIETIMSRLERWYDMEVEYGDERVKKQIFTGIMTRHTDVKDILYLIGNTADVKFEWRGDTVVVSTK